MNPDVKQVIDAYWKNDESRKSEEDSFDLIDSVFVQTRPKINADKSAEDFDNSQRDTRLIHRDDY